MLFVTLVLSVALAQVAPGGDSTKPVSSNAPISIPLTKTEKAKKNSRQEIVVLDARPFFEYSVSHAEKAQPIKWEDYSQNESPNHGLLEPDLNLIARKLRAYGISPESEVVILGKGKSGYGEEGRIAWMLNYVGVNKVVIKSEEDYSAKRTAAFIQNNRAPAVWLVKLNEKIRIRLSELQKTISGERKVDYALIDTRSKKEYDQAHLPGAVHIEFKEFINNKNEPINSEQLKDLLKKYKLNTQAELIFYCTAGVRSGYATFVASNLGLNARHFDGGTDLWFYQKN